MTISLEIYSSIIFPKSPSAFDGAMTIGIAPPSPTHPGASIPKQIGRALVTGPENPLYRLPQALSSGGLKIHLNAFVQPHVRESLEDQAEVEITRGSRTSVLDKEHILYEISKAPLGADYTLACFRHGRQSGGYGYGQMSYVPGWLSGGAWMVEYITKAPGTLVEHKLKLMVDEGGKEDGVWKLVEPVRKIIARETAQQEGSSTENGRGIEFYEDEVVGLAGMSEQEWRDLVIACWITKVWREATRVPFLNLKNSLKKGDATNLRRW